jgi:hypothetical protein
MPQVSTSSAANIPLSFESSAMRTYRDREDTSRAWLKLRDFASELQNLRNAVTKQNEEFRRTRRRILGGVNSGGGIPWQTPYRELDPTVYVAAGTWVYISPENTLVTSGRVDLVSGITIKAVPGIWEAAQDVPAAVTAGYNVPQPLAQAVPSGTPLMGDMDVTTLFWRPISPALVCH